MQATEAMQRQARDWRMTTAEIRYHLPDNPEMLQTFIWQQLDQAPLFPALRKFLDFWNREIEGRLHSVRVGACTLVSPGEAARLRYLH